MRAPLTFLFGSVAIFSLAPTVAHAEPFEHARIVPEDRLDTVRGGFVLPNGMDIGLGVTILTTIDGRPALTTVMTIDDTTHLAIYGGGEMKRQAEASGVLVPGPDGPALIRVTPGSAPAPSGGERSALAVTPNGAAIQTPFGAVQLTQSETQSTVTLVGSGLEVRQMIGAITGAVVANTADNRVINNIVTVDLDVRHSAIPTSSAMLRLDTLLAGAAARGAN